MTLETNITAWRRVVCADLTVAFDDEPPDHERHPDDVPIPPIAQALPVQERGVRRARAIPYELQADSTVDAPRGTFRIDFANTGDAGACFQVRSGNSVDGPRTYTVEAGKSLFDRWSAAPDGRYDLSVYGPNGFLRAFRGSVSSPTKVEVDCHYDSDDRDVILQITNLGRAACKVTVSNTYEHGATAHRLRPGQSVREKWWTRGFCVASPVTSRTGVTA